MQTRLIVRFLFRDKQFWEAPSAIEDQMGYQISIWTTRCGLAGFKAHCVSAIDGFSELPQRFGEMRELAKMWAQLKTSLSICLPVCLLMSIRSDESKWWDRDTCCECAWGAKICWPIHTHIVNSWWSQGSGSKSGASSGASMDPLARDRAGKCIQAASSMPRSIKWALCLFSQLTPIGYAVRL